MERDIIEINEELCVGCGNCVPNCHQGALQVIDGKVRLLSDLMCEGLGACVGHCPTGAMKVSRREAPDYDEALVMEQMMAAGPNVLKAHLEHLIQHSQTGYLAQARQILADRGIADPSVQGADPAAGLSGQPKPASPPPAPARSLDLGALQAMVHGQPDAHGGHGQGEGGCPGSRARTLRSQGAAAVQPGPGPATGAVKVPSELGQWPVQLHLLSPAAPFLAGADLLLAADCTAYAAGGFHRDYLRGKALAIACPKLDDGQDGYVEKLAAMVDQGGINTLTVLIMEVPCCQGLLRIAQAALARASRKVPLKLQVLSLEGDLQREAWV